ECAIGINMDTSRDSPLSALLGRPHVEDEYRAPLLQPLPQGVHFHRKVRASHVRSLLVSQWEAQASASLVYLAPKGGLGSPEHLIAPLLRPPTGRRVRGSR